jgi:hypothetical protein
MPVKGGFLPSSSAVASWFTACPASSSPCSPGVKECEQELDRREAEDGERGQADRAGRVSHANPAIYNSASTPELTDCIYYNALRQRGPGGGRAHSSAVPVREEGGHQGQPQPPHHRGNAPADDVGG